MSNKYIYLESLYTVEEDLKGTGFQMPNITSDDFKKLIKQAKQIVKSDRIKEIEAFGITNESFISQMLAPKRLSVRFIVENMAYFYTTVPGLIKLDEFKPSNMAQNKRALEGMKLFIYKDILNVSNLHFMITYHGKELGLNEDTYNLIKSNIKEIGTTVDFKVSFDSRYFAALKFYSELSFEKERLKLEIKNELESMINFEIPSDLRFNGLRFQQDLLKQKYIEVIEPNFL